MKTITPRTFLLTAALLVGGGAYVTTATPARADSKSQLGDARRDVDATQRLIKRLEDQKRTAKTPRERSDADKHLRAAQDKLRSQQDRLRDVKQVEQPTYAHGLHLSGTVTALHSGNSFDLRVGSKTYNIFAKKRLPARLTVGDGVRVNGKPANANDIRNADVTVAKNR